MRWRSFSLGLVLLLASLSANGRDGTTVRVTVHADAPTGVYSPIWSYFGADEPNYIYGPHGRKLLDELGELGDRRMPRSTSACIICSPVAMARAH